jgi:hypothetical protein
MGINDNRDSGLCTPGGIVVGRVGSGFPGFLLFCIQKLQFSVFIKKIGQRRKNKHTRLAGRPKQSNAQQENHRAASALF